MAKNQIPRDADIVSLGEQETAATPKVATEDPNTFQYHLKNPIQVFQDEVSTLTLRKPTGLDVIQLGNPVIFFPDSDSPRMEHDFPKMQRMIARLANIPQVSVGLMSAKDLIGLSWEISGFFLPTT